MPADNVIEIRGLTNRFGITVIHEDLSLDVRRGEVLGVVGASGSGKSVLLRTIVGLQTPAAGQITLLGTDVLTASAADRAAASARTGVMFQDGALFSVLTIALDRDDPAMVRVRVEVFASTPVRADTIATLASQGVTGVAFIALEGGTAGADRLRAVPPADVPLIRSELSVVQDLMITGPDLLSEATALIAEVRGFATPQNREAIAGILSNLNDATGQIEAITARTEATLSRIDAAVAAAEGSFTSADGLLEREIPALFADLKAAVASTTGAMNSIGSLAQRDLPALSGQAGTLILDASRVIAAFDALARQIGNDPGRFLLGNETPEYRRTE